MEKVEGGGSEGLVVDLDGLLGVAVPRPLVRLQYIYKVCHRGNELTCLSRNRAFKPADAPTPNATKKYLYHTVKGRIHIPRTPKLTYMAP